MTPILTQAAIFSFDPVDLRNDGHVYLPGFIFTVKFLLDTEGAKISAVDGAALFTFEDLEIVNISTEHSIFRLWVRKPGLISNTNIIEFVGKVPEGFSGVGEIFSATFRVKTEKTAHLSTLYTRLFDFAALPIKLSASKGEAWYPFAIPNRIPKNFVFARDFKMGDRNLDVAYLQLVLKVEELYHGDISGRFDGITREAVLAFQERYLEDILISGRFDQPTGDVEFWTRAKLNRLLSLDVFEESEPSPEQISEESSPLFDIRVSPGPLRPRSEASEQQESKTRTVAVAVVIVVIIGAAIGAAAYLKRSGLFVIILATIFLFAIVVTAAEAAYAESFGPLRHSFSEASEPKSEVKTSSGNLVTRVAPGELLPVSVKLVNFGGGRRVDVTIDYYILNEKGDVVLTEKETVAVETTASFIKILQIPRNIPSGKYIAESSITYQGQEVPATASYQFTVERKIAGIFMSQFLFYGAITLTVGVVFMIAGRIVKKNFA